MASLPVSPATRQTAPAFDLVFSPSATLIGVVRRFVEEFYVTVLEDRDVASRLALTSHELLENAVKYSIDGKVALRVVVKDGTVDVRTINRAAPPQIELLRKYFAEIEAAPDAGELYARMLQRTAALSSGSGGIGLARIWAESEMAVRLEVTGEQVAIHAQGPIVASA
jgi:hypothetical protein